MTKYFILASLLLISASCSTSSDDSEARQNHIAARVFASNIQEFQLQVFYESGAEPYVGTLSLGGPQTWQITEDSYKALFSQHTFEGSPRTLTIPNTLGAMTSIAAQGVISWNSSQLVNLGNTLAPNWDQSSRVAMSAIFLHGSFEGNSNVLGVQISGSPFAFIFKDNIISTGGTTTQQKYAEQAVVIHEVGHAVGLVNNGVPMVLNHEDVAHPHHSNNSDCVMYWAIESSSSIISSIDNFITLGQLNLFANEVLDDANAFQP